MRIEREHVHHMYQSGGFEYLLGRLLQIVRPSR